MLSVLLIEDDPALLELTRDYLQRKGSIVADTAVTATEALKKIRMRNYDAVISDYLMPEMDGIALLKSIRSSGNQVPFIVFTGRSREHVVIEALNNGASFYLQKGGDPKSQFAELENMIIQAAARRRAEEALRESIKRLTDIINFLPDATFAVDRAGRVVAWNHAMEEMTGFPAHRMLGKEEREYSLAFYSYKRPLLLDLIYSPDEEVEGWGYTRVKRKGTTLAAETGEVTPGGKKAVLWVIATPLFDENGAVAGAIESVRDITGVRDAQEAQHRCESKFRTIFEHSPVAIALFDTEGSLVEMNRSGLELISGNYNAFAKYFNLFGSRIIPPSAKEALIRGETVRFRLAPGSAASEDVNDSFVPPVHLDILVSPLHPRKGMPGSGFLMQFREVHGKDQPGQMMTS